MANVGTAPAGKTLIGQGDTSSSKFADIGTDSGLTEHGVLLAQGAGAFTATAEGVDGSLLIGATGADPAMALPTSINNTLTFHPTANGLGFEDRRWLTAFVVDPSASVGERGTYQTIAAAMTAASSGDTIFIRPGTYTENITLKAGVNLTSFTGEGAGQVTIVGKLSASGAGTSVISNIELETNGDFVAEITGANATVLNFYNCRLTLTDNTGISNTGSGASAINIYESMINCNASGITYFACTNGTLSIYRSIFNNQGASTTSSTFSGTALIIRWSFLSLPITTSGASATFEALSSQWETTNATAINHNGTSSYNSMNYCFLNTGTATPMTIGTGATMFAPSLNLRHSNATAVSGLGTLVYGEVIQTNTVGTLSASVLTKKAVNLGGISFDGTANTMSNYAEGTFSPTLTGSTTPPDAIGYSTRLGSYTRIGDTVFVQVNIVVNSFTLGAGAGNLIISDLPFTAESDNNSGIWTVQFGGVDFSAGTNYCVSQVQPNSTTIAFLEIKDNAAATVVPLSAVAAGDVVRLSGTYKV